MSDTPSVSEWLPEWLRPIVIDKSEWPSGPWMHEPDRVVFSYAGFRCFILRAPTTGALCGYVAIPSHHPLYGLEQEDVELSVHGGLTFWEVQGALVQDAALYSEEDVRWAGFDCSHFGDYSPGLFTSRAHAQGYALPPPPSSYTYKDIDYVRREVCRLVDQIALAGPPTRSV